MKKIYLLMTLYLLSFLARGQPADVKMVIKQPSVFKFSCSLSLEPTGYVKGRVNNYYQDSPNIKDYFGKLEIISIQYLNQSFTVYVKDKYLGEITPINREGIIVYKVEHQQHDIYFNYLYDYYQAFIESSLKNYRREVD